ncbi:MAG: hypothetical protein R3B84_12030 [Zavarzinella sp.]
MANWKSAQLKWTLTWDADWVTAVEFLTDQHVVAGNNLGQMMSWDFTNSDKTGKTAPPPTRLLVGHQNSVTRIRKLPGSSTFFSSSFDHSIQTWSADSPTNGKQQITLNATAIADAEARKRNGAKVPPPITAEVSLQQSVGKMTGHTDWIADFAISADGKNMLSGDDGNQVIWWDLATQKELHRWKLKGWAYAIAISPDKKTALISERIPRVFDSGSRNAVGLWEMSSGKLMKDLSPDFKMYIASAVFSPDGKSLYLGQGGEANGKLFRLELEGGKKPQELSPAHQYGVTDFALDPTGKLFASAGRDTVVRIWDVASGKMLAELGKPRGGQFKDWIHAVSFSPNGQMLAAADMAGAVQIWEAGKN